MELVTILNNNNINIEKVEEALINFGHSLSEFEQIPEAQIPILTAVFKELVNLDLKQADLTSKIELRVKIRRIINGYNISDTVQRNAAFSKIKTSNLMSKENKKSKPNKKKSKPIPSEKKLGKVKFFDSNKGFGYIYSFIDDMDCFVHVSKLINSVINDDSITIFETISSVKKPGNLDAIKVSNYIPVFIFNNENTLESLVYPLINNELGKVFKLTAKYENGFAVVTAHAITNNWKISIIQTESISKEKTISFGKIILAKLLQNINNYQEAIKWLASYLENEIPENELSSLYNDVFKYYEEISALEIIKIIKAIIDISYFKSFIDEKNNTLNKFSIALWFINEIDKFPNARSQSEVDIWRFDVLPSLDWKTLQAILTKLLSEHGATKQIKESYKYLIDKGWDIDNRIDLKMTVDFIKVFQTDFPTISFSENNFRCLDNEFYVELYEAGVLNEISEDRIKQHIDSLKTDINKSEFIEKLPDHKIISYYTLYPSLFQYQVKYIHTILEQEISKIDFLCFDLESDGKKINEFAWKNKLKQNRESDADKIEKGIEELVTLINAESLVIGHNIREFDLEVLNHFNATPNPKSIWDTLEIEMLLNPKRFSYGLKTKHNAAVDTELTYQLFKNQLSRIISSKHNLDRIKELLPIKAKEFINQLGENTNWSYLDNEYFENESNDFFRPNPSNQNISEQTFKQLVEKLNEEGNKVIIAPDFLWNTLSYQFNLTFYSSNKTLCFCLNKDKIEATLADGKLLKAILFRFVDSCIDNSVLPYYEHLPNAIKLKLSQEQASLICDYIDIDVNNFNHTPICIKPDDIEILKLLSNQITDINVTVIGNELFNLTSKLQLGQDFDFATIFAKLKNEPIWLQMSGGKSFISLKQRHCIQLGISEFPEFIHNIWLEKIGKGKFKVWCNIKFEDYLNHLSIQTPHYIDWVDENNTNTNAFVVRPDEKKAGYIAEQKRVNPESLYRKLYWVYQFKLFEGIGNYTNPKVLIVNDASEIEKITAFARKIGFFIPDTKATLARQLEILHAYKSSRKLFIGSFDSLDKIIANNYSGPLNIVWDSFLLQEKAQMLQGKFIKGNEPIQEINEDDFHSDTKSDHKDFDSFTLIKLHKPIIDYYYKMLYDNNPDSQLFLCDSRLTDYFGIEKNLNLNAQRVPMWYKEADYASDLEIASDFFSAIHENANTDFDIDEAKEILRHIFLQREEGSIPYHWHYYQHTCLNDILPAKKDLLVSLPTGAGKSLLFQGPALFRSAFSCKLSIVISPLRALMQDQVEGLWKKGFYSNVEYLSGDKTPLEIRDIYRRISGGEITLLYITPERFRSRSFENCLLTRLDVDHGLEYAIFDEAHCISQWGQEFRPDYLNAGRKIADYSGIYEIRKLLFSATISEQVFEEIGQLMPGVVPIEGTDKSYNPVRDHIKMNFKHNVIEDERLTEVANYLKSGNFNPTLSRAIVFVKSRKKVDECTLLMPDTLKSVFGNNCEFKDKVGAFHAGMDSGDRNETYEKYKSGEIAILFATKAFGMGMDIPNIHFVTHYSPPSTFEDFLQEVGRAGRNEEKRKEAGFNNTDNPINTLCLTTDKDFGNLKDQLHKSRIAWHEINEIKDVIEQYISRFKPLLCDTEIPLAVPFNLYSNELGEINDELDTKFRIGLHWLERLERIKLGYFTITHIEIDAQSLNNLSERISLCPNQECEMVCLAILELLSSNLESGEIVQLPVASLRSKTKLSLQNLFTALLKNHAAGIFKLIQYVVIEPTKLRLDEINHYKDIRYANIKYPALQVIFSLVHKIMNSIPLNSSKFFEGEELDDLLKDSIHDQINFDCLPWTNADNDESKRKEIDKYIKDIVKKRSKHAFTIIRLLGKTKHESKMEKVVDSNRKTIIKQSVFNGYHKKEEWKDNLDRLKNDCLNVLDFVATEYFTNHTKTFNWPDIITKLKLNGNVQYLSDLLFILSVLGYSRTGGLLPSGIEVYLHSTDPINETIDNSLDKRIYAEFNETQEIRELKLISLQVLSKLPDDKKDSFIRGFFGAKNKLELINHLQNVGEIDENHPIFKAFRGDAIKFQEEYRLNDEQRAIYIAETNQNINVMAGPGSGKTHTLTLRVARLIFYKFANPEEILVLAYNRAVVSELKDRLGKLFKELGFGNLANRIKIFTFHGLAKKYCQNQLNGMSFNQWEPYLLEKLNNNPGMILNQLAPLKHILVDEFQDINEVRMDILYRLNNLTKANIFIIGDPNQSIYGYDRDIMDPYHYYNDFDQKFKPAKFELYDNHRSYPEILNLASEVLALPEDRSHLIPRATRKPDANFMPNYAQIIDRTKERIDWWNQIPDLMQEKVENRPYKQIAILFRTNNEVYRGYQKIRALNLPYIRIRIQGRMPYEFTRIRECHAVLEFLRQNKGKPIPVNFKQLFSDFTRKLIEENVHWNHFYIRVIHALVLEYLEEQDENLGYDELIEYIHELTYKDDGQLYKIYEKHLNEISVSTQETEIVLTTMHKVKGLEFDCVVIPPSFSNLPLNANHHIGSEKLQEELAEEKRLAFVAYTRARYRLLIFKHKRELALANNTEYLITEGETILPGIPVQPEIIKLKIGWAARAFNFNRGVNDIIHSSVKSGDSVFIRRRIVPNNGNPFCVNELFKDNIATPIGELANDANIMNGNETVSGFVVNEVVVWTFEETCKYDIENNTAFARDWCQDAINKGYIYLVDFAGFGTPGQ
jgi:RecQ family ATP-dependent DNA helicase